MSGGAGLRKKKSNTRFEGFETDNNILDAVMEDQSQDQSQASQVPGTQDIVHRSESEGSVIPTEIENSDLIDGENSDHGNSEVIIGPNVEITVVGNPDEQERGAAAVGMSAEVPLIENLDRPSDESEGSGNSWSEVISEDSESTQSAMSGISAETLGSSDVNENGDRQSDNDGIEEDDSFNSDNIAHLLASARNGLESVKKDTTGTDFKTNIVSEVLEQTLQAVSLIFNQLVALNTDNNDMKVVHNNNIRQSMLAFQSLYGVLGGSQIETLRSEHVEDSNCIIQSGIEYHRDRTSARQVERQEPAANETIRNDGMSSGNPSGFPLLQPTTAATRRHRWQRSPKW